MPWLLLIPALLVLGYAVARRIGAARWEAGTRALRDRLRAVRSEPPHTTVDLSALEPLPPPVQRFLRTALTDGTAVPRVVRFQHEGTFAMGGRWHAFKSDQLVTLSPPGFDWDATIAMAPGLPARVHDAYVDGTGLLRAALLGLVTVAEPQPSDELSRGELLRWLAETPWYPAALLPRPHLVWTPVDAHRARATLRDGAHEVSLTFTFDDDRITGIRAEQRARMDGERTEHLPWEGRFWDHAQRGDVVIPLEAEVGWHTEQGWEPYWRGRITAITVDPPR